MKRSEFNSKLKIISNKIDNLTVDNDLSEIEKVRNELEELKSSFFDPIIKAHNESCKNKSK